MSRPSFREFIRARIEQAITEVKPIQIDRDRFRPPWLAQITLKVGNAVARTFGISAGRLSERRESALAEIDRRQSEFSAAFDLLADDWSRAAFVRVVLYQLLGPRHVQILSDPDEYWRERRGIQQRYLRSRHQRIASGWELDGYRIDGANGPIELDCRELDVHAMFIRQQYAYRRGAALIEARAGDVVVDGGACWGDTALYFSDRVGPDGAVYSFEFVPANLAVLRQNLRYNSALQSRIHLVEHAISDRSGETWQIDSQGPSSGVSAAGATPATTLALDDWVDRSHNRPTFIKLDIEGSERNALEGARNYLRSAAPRLAVAAYHSLDDLIGLPQQVHDLNPAYRIYLDHFTTYGEETVLFATAE